MKHIASFTANGGNTRLAIPIESSNKRKEIYGMRTISREPTYNGDHNRWFEDEKGRKYYGLLWQRSAKVDIDDGSYLSEIDKEVYAASDLPTVRELVKRGVLIEKTPYDICECFSNSVTNIMEVSSVVDFFRENGYNVTEDAVRHNMSAWEHDLKSGYRDEQNGYHLFTPCGCNELRFTLTTLCDTCDWQNTYSV